ncbi:MAG: FAD:protein FMN transferase [Phycisphaeraceae bacterium]
MAMLNRRRMLRVSLGGLGALGLAGAGLAGWATLPRRGREAEGTLQTVRQSSRALGTDVSITVLHADVAQAERAIAAAFAELDHVEDLMSIYRPHSQLSQLNRQRVLKEPDAKLLEVLRYANDLSHRTGGTFDVTVQPLWNLYAQAHRANSLPDANEIAAARAKVNWRRVSVSPTEVRLLDEGMAITLNGIAQGYAADRVAAVLRAHGIVHALVDTGELGAIGGKDANEPWQVGIQHPREVDAFIALAALKDRCLATSGDYATTFSADRTRHHVFDPRTGSSPTSYMSVSVAAPTAMQADALSTALFVLGMEEGLALIERTEGVDALFVLADGSTRCTAHFPAPSPPPGEGRGLG